MLISIKLILRVDAMDEAKSIRAALVTYFEKLVRRMVPDRMHALSGKRRHKRVRYNLSIGCIGTFAVCEGNTENLSEDGACIVVNEFFESGALLPLILKLPTRVRPIVVSARVMWSCLDETRGAIKCGLQYLWISRDDREALKKFLGVFKDENE